MKTCPTCYETFPDENEVCPNDGSRLVEFRDERDCPYCAERILRKARFCKHCRRDVEPLEATNTPVQTGATPPSPAASAEPATLVLADLPQGAWEGTSAGRILAPPKPASSRATPERAERMQYFIAISLILVALVFGGIWYFFLPTSNRPLSSTESSASNSVPARLATGAKLGQKSLLFGFRGLHAGQSRSEVESVLRAQHRIMTCAAPERDGIVDCKSPFASNTEISNMGFYSDGKLHYFRFMIYSSDSQSSSQAVYRELTNTLGRGKLLDSSHDSTLEYLTRISGVREFEWNEGGPVPCSYDAEIDCPAQQLTLAISPGLAQVELWDYQYLAKSEGITKLDPNRPQPKVNKTFVLFGLEGGEAQADTETTLRGSGYSTPACKYDSEGLTDKCDTTNGTHSLSLEFFQNRLVSFTFNFPKSDWGQQVRFFKATLGEPTDGEKRTDQEVLAWSSEETIPCLNDADKQCTAEALFVSTDNDHANCQAVYFYMPLENEVIVEQARQMTQGQ